MGQKGERDVQLSGHDPIRIVNWPRELLELLRRVVVELTESHLG
jgi:hypothetical protein